MNRIIWSLVLLLVVLIGLASIGVSYILTNLGAPPWVCSFSGTVFALFSIIILAALSIKADSEG